MTTQTIDQTRVDAFVDKALGDLSATTTYLLAVLDDRLDLFTTLAGEGPATSDELAQRAGINERYAREWLAGLAAAGYLDYDPDTTRYTLPAEHAPVLVEEGGPVFLGGACKEISGILPVLDNLTEAFRTGGGAPSAAYDERFWNGLERFTGTWYDHQLIPVWLPEIPAATEKLEAGADVAEVGCGHGRALITLAEAFPTDRYVGYDLHGPAIDRARRAAEQAGVADRVRFEHRDVAGGLADTYDVILTCAMVHDAVDPAGLLRNIRGALRPDGRYACVDINASHRPEDNTGPLAALFCGLSVLYCMTTSLAHDGPGLGTCGFNPRTAEQLCRDAGFSEVRRVPLDNPFTTSTRPSRSPTTHQSHHQKAGRASQRHGHLDLRHTTGRLG
jgi:SAM-dependent methyltransferase